MALTASFSTSIVLSGSSISGVASISDGEITQVNNVVAAGNNTTETLAIAFDKDKLRGVYVQSDVACQVTFGGTSNPDLALAAGVPFVWHDASNITNPFSNNCTNMVIVNNNATNNATVQAVFVLDPT